MSIHTAPGGNRPSLIDGPQSSDVDGVHSAYTADLIGRLGVRVLFIGTIAVLAALYVLEANLPPNAIEFSSQHATITKEFLPEGWAFFTASPRTVYPVPWRQSLPGAEWAPLHDPSLAVPSQLMGLSRTQRSEGTALAILESQVPTSSFVACQSTPAACLAADAHPVPVVNVTPHTELCGELGIAEQQVLPWAWRGSGTALPSRVVRLDVRC